MLVKIEIYAHYPFAGQNYGYETLGDTYPFTWPLFQQDADLLVGKMQQYGVEELQKLLKVSKSLAEKITTVIKNSIRRTRQ